MSPEEPWVKHTEAAVSLWKTALDTWGYLLERQRSPPANNDNNNNKAATTSPLMYLTMMHQASQAHAGFLEAFEKLVEDPLRRGQPTMVLPRSPLGVMRLLQTVRHVAVSALLRNDLHRAQMYLMAASHLLETEWLRDCDTSRERRELHSLWGQWHLRHRTGSEQNVRRALRRIRDEQQRQFFGYVLDT